ncbi:MAG: hypothetical protein M0R80_17635 [Proteobacteria bacterium]|jgi:hypothetical protein|nr:hypothetical protein [Pseudomonadota bacterium]
MAANTQDYFSHVGSPGTATTLAAPGHLIGGTSITVVSTTNWSTDTGVVFAMDTVSIVNGVEVRDVGSYTEWTGIVTGATTIESMVLRYGSDQNYPAGSTSRVYIPVASSRENRLVDGLLIEHKQTGKHAAVTADSVVVADGGNIEVDHILEAAAAHGVDIDGLLIKDGKLATNDSVVTDNITAGAVTNAKLSTTAGNGALFTKIITATRDAGAAGAPTDVSYTGVGFIPSSIKCIGVRDGTLYRSNGFSDSAKANHCTYQSAANVYYDIAALTSYSDQASWAQSAVVKSYDADGFTLTWTKAGTPAAGTFKLTFICER